MEKTMTFDIVIILIKSIFIRIKVRIGINPIHIFSRWMLVYYKCYISIELTFLKELILIKQANQKNVIYATISTF